MTELLKIHSRYIFRSKRVVAMIGGVIIYLTYNIFNKMNMTKLLLDLEKEVELIQSLFRPTFTFILFPCYLILLFKRFSLYEVLEEPFNIRLYKESLKVYIMTEVIFDLPFVMYSCLHILLYMPVSLQPLSILIIVLEVLKYLFISLIMVYVFKNYKVNLKVTVIIIMFVNLVVSNYCVSMIIGGY